MCGRRQGQAITPSNWELWWSVKSRLTINFKMGQLWSGSVPTCLGLAIRVVMWWLSAHLKSVGEPVGYPLLPLFFLVLVYIPVFFYDYYIQCINLRCRSTPTHHSRVQVHDRCSTLCQSILNPALKAHIVNREVICSSLPTVAVFEWQGWNCLVAWQGCADE